MDGKRLEELAVFMEAEAEWSKQYGTPQLTQDYTDLARCARFAAKLERLGSELWCVSVDEWGDWALMTGYEVGGSPTAIEAVEAAEVKP